MRKLVAILVLLGAGFWWFSIPPKVATRVPVAPIPAHPAAATAPSGNSASPTTLLDATPTPSKSTPTSKSPLQSAVNLRKSQADRASKQQKQMQSIP
ncbi:hypothetical protein BH09VER1_BH09VER1_49440 [soil metagenome]